MNDLKLFPMIMLLPLLLVISGCTKQGPVPVYINRSVYIEDLNYTSDTNYTTTDYNLVVTDNNVIVPIPIMKDILNKSTYYRQEAMVKDIIIDSYKELILFNNDLSKGNTHE